MKRILSVCMLAVTVTVFSTMAGCDQLPGKGQGWTGVTNTQDIITARQTIMVQMEDLMIPIDTYTVDITISPDIITESAETIFAMLLAVPHLFPPTTNLYDPNAKQPVTLALPGIWEDFPVFYKLASASLDSAAELVYANGPEALNEGAQKLRATCDACHALFLLPYESPKPGKEDIDFINSLFKKD